jgi:hypothetical protein
MGDNGTMKNTEPRISVRVEPGLKKRLEKAAAHTGIDEATITRNCIEAFCSHVEKTGAITFPIAITTAGRKPGNLVFNESEVSKYEPIHPASSTSTSVDNPGTTGALDDAKRQELRKKLNPRAAAAGLGFGQLPKANRPKPPVEPPEAAPENPPASHDEECS